MIDTDKYEGHTPGPWVCTHSPVNGGKQFWSVVDHTQPTDVGDDTLGNWRIADIIDFEADAQLIADAPLLLEAYKELREWKAEVERICRTMSGPNRDTALFIMTNEVEEE